jgi:ATP-dependent DNA helicase RecG
LDWATVLILHQVAFKGNINTNQATQLLENNVTHATILLNRLLELGLLEARGFKRTKTYHLSAAVYGQLGKPEAYVRQRGLVATEQEIMVSSLLKAKSEITRADVMRLFTTLSEDQASYLLRRLVKQGKLEMVGIRNKAIYRTIQK